MRECIYWHHFLFRVSAPGKSCWSDRRRCSLTWGTTARHAGSPRGQKWGRPRSTSCREWFSRLRGRYAASWPSWEYLVLGVLLGSSTWSITYHCQYCPHESTCLLMFCFVRSVLYVQFCMVHFVCSVLYGSFCTFCFVRFILYVPFCMVHFVRFVMHSVRIFFTLCSVRCICMYLLYVLCVFHVVFCMLSFRKRFRLVTQWSARWTAASGARSARKCGRPPGTSLSLDHTWHVFFLFLFFLILCILCILFVLLDNIVKIVWVMVPSYIGNSFTGSSLAKPMNRNCLILPCVFFINDWLFARQGEMAERYKRLALTQLWEPVFEPPWIRDSCFVHPLRKVLNTHKYRYLIIIIHWHMKYIYTWRQILGLWISPHFYEGSD